MSQVDWAFIEEIVKPWTSPPNKSLHSQKTITEIWMLPFGPPK